MNWFQKSLKGLAVLKSLNPSCPDGPSGLPTGLYPLTAVTEPNVIGSKVCTKCNVEKPLADFRPVKRAKDGLSWNCRECLSAYRRQHHIDNREHNLKVNREWTQRNYDSNRAYQKRWHAENKEHHSRWGKEWYKKNKKHHNAKSKAWYERNREIVNLRAKEWKLDNPEKVLESLKRYNEKYPERRKESCRKWARANPHIVRERAMRRYAAKRNATPKWLTDAQKKQILEFYEVACWLTAHETPCHVDHIEPLRGKYQCGLHVPWNLQILTAEENIKKGSLMPY